MSQTFLEIMKTPYFFVYGTLKRGYGNNTLLRESAFRGQATTLDSFCMSGWGFPYVFEKEGLDTEIPTHRVRGELYEVDDFNVVRALDWLEGVEHNHYKRSIVKVNSPLGDVDCHIYLATKDTSENIVDRTESKDITRLLIDEGERFYEWGRF